MRRFVNWLGKDLDEGLRLESLGGVRCLGCGLHSLNQTVNRRKSLTIAALLCAAQVRRLKTAPHNYGGKRTLYFPLAIGYHAGEQFKLLSF